MSEITEAMLAAGESAMIANTKPRPAPPHSEIARGIYLAMANPKASEDQRLDDALCAMPIDGYVFVHSGFSDVDLVWLVFQAMVEARDAPAPPFTIYRVIPPVVQPDVSHHDDPTPRAAVLGAWIVAGVIVLIGFVVLACRSAGIIH